MKHMKISVIALIFSTVLFGCAGDTASRSTGEYVDDSVITTKVKTALLDDPVVKGLEINVETFKGVIQLSGFANSDVEKDQAGRLAKSVEGVVSVENDIIVK